MSIELNKIFGQAMKAWRSGRGLNQEKAAELFGISQAAYSNLELGRVDTSLSTVAKAAEITGLSPCALLSPQGSPEASGGVQKALDFLLSQGYSVTLSKAPAAPRPQGEGSPS
jgi:transcriptional regulator with XRE-family HTH domain